MLHRQKKGKYLKGKSESRSSGDFKRFTLGLRRERIQLLSTLAARRIAAARKRVLKSVLIESQKMSVDLISGPLDSAATGLFVVPCGLRSVEISSRRNKS